MVLLPQKWSHNRHSPQAKRKLHNKSKRDAHDLTPQGGAVRYHRRLFHLHDEK